MRLSTIGYEGAALPDFLYTLKMAGVTRVVDIRAVPQSRRPGFSKRVLAAALSEAGIAYEHQKPLGDPKEGRDAARAGDYIRFRNVYTQHLSTVEARTALVELETTAKYEHCALLCYERNPKECHRALVTLELTRKTAFDVQHLGVHAPPKDKRGSDVGTERYAGA